MTAEFQLLDLTTHWAGFTCLGIFALAYLLVAGEEPLSLRKSKPMMVAAGVIWALVAVAYGQQGDTHTAEKVLRQGLSYYTELFLFLLAAMTYVNAMSERGVFAVLRHWLISRNFSYRRIYWTVGGLAFVISAVANNLTTALLMATVVTVVGKDSPRFLVASCVSIVVAANAGGSFSPFGDVTTLMVWQRGALEFHAFFLLFLPALVNWLVPAVVLSFTVPAGDPETTDEAPTLAHGAGIISGLFVVTIALAVAMEHYLHLPGAVGMMTGLGVLKLYGYYLKRQEVAGEGYGYDIFHALEQAEWDTLMFFFGTIMSVMGLMALGYLTLASTFMYGDLGATTANIMVGLLSGVVENVPVMFSVLGMDPQMSQGQWLLVTLTAGVGGSLLSIGSAAGVAVMGQARGTYTFFAHLKWSWLVALGFAASIGTHFLVNGGSFT